MSERRFKTKDERDANRVVMAIAANEAMREHLAGRAAFHKNYEKLRTERLIREASCQTKPIVESESGLNRWTKRDEETLRTMIAQKAPVKEIAAAINRSNAAVYGHVAALKKRALLIKRQAKVVSNALQSSEVGI